MSVQSDIHEFLASVAKGHNGDFVPMEPGTMADQVGVSRNKINKTLFNLSTTGKIELQRAENGRNIIGFKVLEGPVQRQRNGTKRLTRTRLAEPVTIQPGQVKRRRTLPTPAIDAYAHSKETFNRLTTELGEYITAEFNTNPIAEEALMLRERLDSIEGQWSDMRARLDEAEREARALRGRHQRELAEAVAKEGTAVSHGD